MRIKKYLINLWDKIKFDEAGQYEPWTWGGGAAYTPPKPKPPSIPYYDPTSIAGYKYPKPIAPYVPKPPSPTALKYFGPTPVIEPWTGGSSYTPPPTPKYPYEPPPPQPSLTDAMTGAITPQVTREVTGGAQFGLMGYPALPDLTAGLSSEDLARIEKESGMLSELEFGPAFRQLEQNLIESKRVATEEREEAVPIYEKSMRDTAATVANAIAGWAQKLNQIGMLRSGAYGRGISRLETAGIAERGGLQKALTERLENISTREADYERDVLDLRAGLEKEKGLRQSTSFERMKREELTYQRDTRQMAFANEVQRSTFMNTMNQMIWQRQMSERQLNAQLEAQSIENQLLRSRISSLYGAAAEGVEVPGVGTLTPGQAFEYGYAPYGEYAEQDPYVAAMREFLGLGGAGATPYTPGGGTPPTTGAIEPWSYQR